MMSKVTKQLQKQDVQTKPVFPEVLAYDYWHKREEVEKQLADAGGSTGWERQRYNLPNVGSVSETCLPGEREAEP